MAVLDGCSRYLVHRKIRERMTEADTETVLQRALEKYPRETLRIIRDKGPQFIARDFEEFIRLAGITHVRSSACYPQSDAKLEHSYGTLKQECTRPVCPESVEAARCQVAAYVDHHNYVRLHSTIGYLTPADKFNGLEAIIIAKQDRKLEKARLFVPQRGRLHDGISNATNELDLGGG
jgi:transposase InsO family protein